MSEVEFFVKLRDAAAMIMDACEEFLASKSPVNRFDAKDFDLLDWNQKDGTKGPYLQTTKEANKDNAEVFAALQKEILEHDGFWQTKSHQYWLHRGEQDTIDRRAKS